jgi:YD repeat-containing protein
MARSGFASRVVVFLLAFGLSPTPARADVRYVYDELGRLIAVIDTGGDTATYTYDAVGNVLSIGRYASTAVSVISFVPVTGPVGTTVTISGTGFSTTPSSNTVTFNGTTATVSSATTTQLVVTVPSSATTGLIAVTAPAGSDASSSAFTVAAPPAPTITSFTPAIGVAGASVTISGTNFHATTVNNRLQFNVTGAAPSSNTSTSISTAVPTHTASGRIKVTTPVGSALSTDDLFVPPSPYVASDVLVTNRMGFNSSTGVALTTANKIGLVVFDGTHGQRVSVKIVTGPASVVRLYNPDTTTLASASRVGPGATFLIEPVAVPRTGTYTVMDDPNSTGTGTVTLTANDDVDVTGTVVPGGSSVSANLATPGQRGLWTFSGTAADRVAVKSDAGAPLGPFLIRKPDGTTLASGTASSFAGFIDTQVLPVTGTYTLVFDPLSVNTGTGTFTAYDVADDVTGTITPGTASTVPITSVGQNGLLTFSGTSGNRYSMFVNAGAPIGLASLLKPNGTSLGSTQMSGFAGFMEPKTLTDTGTHTVKVDPNDFQTGTAVVTLHSVPADLSGTLTVNAAATNVSITGPGQNATYTFSGTASQLITVRVTNNNMGVTVKLLKPDGTTLTQAITGLANFNLTQQTLPTTGTYSVVVDPSTTSTGSLNVQVTNP